MVITATETPIAATPPVRAAAAALAADGLPAAGRLASGHVIARLNALGPDRAAVRWLAPGPVRIAARWLGLGDCPSQPGRSLARCQEALHAAGCSCYFVVAPGGGFLAVLAPAPAAGADRR